MPALQRAGWRGPTSRRCAPAPRRDGDEWVINGQKIWTSGAHYSDYGILVVRTDPTVPKHKGLSLFLPRHEIPRHRHPPRSSRFPAAPTSTRSSFNDVRIPDDQRLGEVGQGWQVAITTLMNERFAIGGGGGVGFRQVFDLAKRLEVEWRARHPRPQRCARSWRTWYAPGRRACASPATAPCPPSPGGDIPGPENSIGKLVGASKTQDMTSFAMDLMELSGAVTDPELRRTPRPVPKRLHGLPRRPNRRRPATRSCSTSWPNAC